MVQNTKLIAFCLVQFCLLSAWLLYFQMQTLQAIQAAQTVQQISASPTQAPESTPSTTHSASRSADPSVTSSRSSSKSGTPTPTPSTTSSHSHAATLIKHDLTPHIPHFQKILPNMTAPAVSIITTNQQKNIENNKDGTLGYRNIDASNLHQSLIAQSLQSSYLAKLFNSMAEGPQNSTPLTNDSLYIVVIAHNRLDYLTEFVNSLRKVKGIEKCVLVVFHHSVDIPIMQYVNTIDFISVKQIIFPYTRTLFPHSFPGESPNDCTRNDPKGRKCNGNPDAYAHFREALYPSLKLQWVWIHNYLWKKVLPAEFEGYAIFFEEDHIVTNQNMLENFELLKEIVEDKNLCNGECLGIALAPAPADEHYYATPGDFYKGVSNVGYGYNRKASKWFEDIWEEYCTFDDYNWDVSLENIFYRQNKRWLIPNPFQAAHIGCSGVHVHNSQCQAAEKQAKDALIAKGKNNVLLKKPGSLRNVPSGIKQGNGGFSDKRDHDLCISFQYE